MGTDATSMAMADAAERSPRAGEADRAAALQAYLADHDHACPLCRYNLRGLRGVRCPECDFALRLQLAIVERWRAAWLAGLVGLAMTLGANVLGGSLLLGAVLSGARSTEPTGKLVLMFGVPAVVAGASVALYLRKTPTFVAMPSFRRWLVVAACWGLPMVNFLWLRMMTR